MDSQPEVTVTIPFDVSSTLTAMGFENITRYCKFARMVTSSGQEIPVFAYCNNFSTPTTTFKFKKIYKTADIKDVIEFLTELEVDVK